MTTLIQFPAPAVQARGARLPNSLARCRVVVALLLVALLGGCSTIRSHVGDVARPPTGAAETSTAAVAASRTPVSDGRLESRPVRDDRPAAMAGENLQALVAYALAHNPALNAAKQAQRGAREQITQATALPDPRLSYRHFLREVETRVGPQQYAIGISQTLPWLGKLQLQQSAASDMAGAAGERVAALRNNIIAEVASAWYELYYLGQSIEIMRGNRDLVAHLERVARARYGAGATTHADVIRAQVELGILENRLASLNDRRAPLFARLNTALNRPANTLLALPTGLRAEPVILTDDALLQAVAANNPELRAAELEIAAAESRRKRAGKNYLPDFTLAVDYIATAAARAPGVRGSGDNALSATVGITLPIWRAKYDAGVQEAAARVEQHRYRRDEQRNALFAETVTALFKLRDAQRQLDLYQNTLLPKANESLAATQRAYSAGSSSFADLIDAQRVLLNFELSHARSVTDHNQARTVIEKLAGQSLVATGLQEEVADESH